MTTHLPQPISLVICDDVIHDPQTGKIHLIGWSSGLGLSESHFPWRGFTACNSSVIIDCSASDSCSFVSKEAMAMSSKTTITRMEGATLYRFEEEAVIFDENGRVIQPKKTKPSRPAAKKPTTKRPRKHGRRA